MKFASKDDVLSVEGEDAIYSLRVPTKRDKIEFARRVRAAGGRAHGAAAIIARVMRVIELKFAADLAERDRLLEIVRGFATERNRIEAAMGPIVTDLFRFIREVAAGRATIADMPATLSRFEGDAASFLPLQEAYSRIENLCERLDDVLADLFADNAQYGAVHNYVAAEMFLTGAVPKPKPADESEAGAATADKPPHWLAPGLFRIAGGRVVAQFLDAMPDADIGAVGDAIWNAMSPSEREKKLRVAAWEAAGRGLFDGFEHWTPDQPAPLDAAGNAADGWVSPALGFPDWAPLRVHPMHLIDEEDRLLVALWAQCRGGEVTGRIGGMAAGIIVSGPIGAILPEAGGMLDQVNCTMESLAVIEAAFQALKPSPHEDAC